MSADVTTSGPPPDHRPESPAPPANGEGAEVASLTPAYGAYYYDTYATGGYELEGHWRQWFGQLADEIIRHFQPRSVLDAGCAKGFLVQALRERGVEAFGIDASEYAVSQAPDDIKPFVSVGSVTEPIDGTYDLITCIEVIEHLAAADLGKAVDALTGAADRILLSSTPEGGHLAEPSHLSMRPQEEWAALFAGAGFFHDVERDVTWLTPWAMVFERQPAATVPDLVRRYERQVARGVREVYELRRTALDLEQRLERVYDESGRHGELGGRFGALDSRAAELAAREERAARAEIENLRLRDLLVVAERQLGQARGELAELREQLLSYQGLADRYHAVVHSTIWQTSWKVLGPYRKFRHGRSGR